jgi:hypothetical protein
MVTSCKNNKIELQMIGSYMESHVVANWMVTYYKISSSGVGLIYVDLIIFSLLWSLIWFMMF